jgi:NAD+ synthase (glutamine-hydrolysing)
LDIIQVMQLRQSREYKQRAAAFVNPFAGINSKNLLALHAPKNQMQPKPLSQKKQPDEEQVYSALVLGLRDYVRKNGFRKVTFGISGGIDSALVATISADALGKENVLAVSMPSHYSSEGSKTDAKKLAENLGISYMTLEIYEIFAKYMETLTPHFQGLPFDLAEENLQARIRGTLLMALSNKFGYLVLATGNKSEVSVGYSTLYGDTAGGFAPLKDVFKTMVYRLSHYRNEKAGYDLIPQEIILKAPSAELKPDQTDQDTLPAYEILDQILALYVEKDMNIYEIIEKGFDRSTVADVIRMVDASEYKRRQAAPGVKITSRAFGKDRRMPITNRYRT